MAQIGRPAGTGRGSTIALANGRFRAQRTVSDEWGNSKRLEAVAATKGKAQAALNAKVKAWTASHVKPSRQRTFKSWADEWIETLETRGSRTKTKKTLALSTVRAYKSTMSNHVAPALGGLQLSAIDVPAVERMLAKIDRPDTSRKALAVLQSCLSDAVHLRLIAENVAMHVTPPKAPRRAETWPTPERLNEIVRDLLADTAPEHAYLPPSGEGTGKRGVRVRHWWRHRSLLAALILTGARPGELLGLRRSHVVLDGDDMYLSLDWQLEEPGWTHGCGGGCGAAKSAACPSRVLALPAGMDYEPLTGTAPDNRGETIDTARVLARPKSDASRREFHAYPDLRAAIELALAEPERWGLVWENRGEPVVEATVRRAWRDLADAFGLDAKSKPYDARHAFIDLLHVKGVPIEIAMSMVGQSSQQVHRGYRTAEKRSASRIGTAMLGSE